MSSSKVFLNYCENALAVLNSQYKASRLLQHNATVGSVREQIIKDFLVGHLPEMVNVVSGQIFDAANNYSRQQDIVLVMKSMPRLPFASGNDLIFQDGVVAIIEIKTRLDSSVLNSIGENIQSVRALSSSTFGSSQMGVTHRWPANKLFSSVITYDGMSLESLESSLQIMDDAKRPDVVLDLGKGLLVRNNGLLLDKIGERDYISIPIPAMGFMFFLTFLTEITGTLYSRGVNWRSYCS